ncbi:SurA N-terminal domain-containing protein [Calycomorphotria hydatis]|uniref:Periplasmic folding chaperone n=1 Tax=Calycomorphotria hydatis TaxID=2528027 RepID=A0A517T466_9PLAN|nr:hypothetical protein [Calycomorphotria hydatis]QDT63167.1 hypothetical protein V22_03850 [Calycomorphotria hydatis]
MANPFNIFRKNMKTLMVPLIGLSMFAFIALDFMTPQNLGSSIPIFAAILGGAALWLLSNKKGWEGAGIFAVGALVFGFVGSYAPKLFPGNTVVMTSAGDLGVGEMNKLGRERSMANSFIGYAQQEIAPRLSESSQLRQFRGFGGNDDRSLLLLYLMNKEADKLGIAVTSESVNDFINEMTADKLNSDDFKSVLRAMGGPSSKEVFNAIKQELRAVWASRILQPRVVKTPDEYWDLFKEANVRQSLAVAEVPVAKFTDQIEDPPEAQLEQFFATYQNVFPNQMAAGEPGFRQPRKVQLAYVEADFTTALENIEPVTDEDVVAYYEANKETRYKQRSNDSESNDLLKESEDLLKSLNLPSGDESKEGEEEGSPIEASKPAAEEPAAPELKAPETNKPAEESTEPEPAEENSEESTESEEQSAIELPAGLSPVFASISDQLTIATSLVAQAEGEGEAEETPAPENSSEEKPAEPAEEKTAEEPVTEPTEEKKPETEGEPAEETKEETAEKPEEPKYRPLDDFLKDEIKEELRRQRAFVWIEQKIQEASEKMLAIRSAAMERVPMADLESDDAKVKEKATEILNTAIGEMVADLREYAKANKLNFVTTEQLPFNELITSEDYPIGSAIDPNQRANPFAAQNMVNVARLVFDTEPGSRRILTGIAEDPTTGSRFAYWKIDDLAAYEPKFSQDGIRDEVLTAWKMKEARELAEKRAEELATMVRESDKELMSEALSDADGVPVTVTGKKGGTTVTVLQTPPFTQLRQTSAPTFGLNLPVLAPNPVPGVDGAGVRFRDLAFDELNPGEVGVSPNADETSYYVVKVVDRSPSSDADMEALRQEFMQQSMYQFTSPYAGVVREERQRTQAAWISNFEKKYNVVWNQQNRQQ